MDPRSDLPTHEVTNQPALPGDTDLWASDPVLRCHARDGDAEALAEHGARLGTVAMREAGRDAERHPPELRVFDRGGRRLDEVAFHPAYHLLLRAGLEAGYAAGPWTGGSHVTHAALVYQHSRVEPGTCCR